MAFRALPSLLLFTYIYLHAKLHKHYICLAKWAHWYKYTSFVSWLKHGALRQVYIVHSVNRILKNLQKWNISCDCTPQFQFVAKLVSYCYFLINHWKTMGEAYLSLQVLCYLDILFIKPIFWAYCRQMFLQGSHFISQSILFTALSAIFLLHSLLQLLACLIR